MSNTAHIQEQVYDSGVGLPRKVTPIGTVGNVGQLFTVYEKNWNCPDCGMENYAARGKCSRCRASKPVGSDNYVLDPALAAIQQGNEIQWEEAIDPTSYQIYYYNKVTGVTQWERPAELGPAPHATGSQYFFHEWQCVILFLGWFGRGKAGSNAALLFAQRNMNYLSRPARKQKEFIDPKKYHLEGANEYNIWYNRYLGEEWDQSNG